VKLILSKPSDHALEDLQLADEHGALVVSGNTKATKEDLLVEKLQNFHWHEETVAGKDKIFFLVAIDGLIIFLFLGKLENWEITEVFNELKFKVTLQPNYYSTIPSAPKAPFRTIDYILKYNIKLSH